LVTLAFAQKIRCDALGFPLYSSAPLTKHGFKLCLRDGG
jgi:hypothetical protein